MPSFTFTDDEPFRGALTYSASEYSIDFDPPYGATANWKIGDEGVTSLVIETLQLEVDIASRRLLHAWGMFPSISWENDRLYVPTFTPGGVYVENCELLPGVSIALGRNLHWSKVYDPGSGWVRVANRIDVTPDRKIEIADGIGLTFQGADLVAVWLRPEFQA